MKQVVNHKIQEVGGPHSVKQSTGTGRRQKVHLRLLYHVTGKYGLLPGLVWSNDRFYLQDVIPLNLQHRVQKKKWTQRTQVSLIIQTSMVTQVSL